MLKSIMSKISLFTAIMMLSCGQVKEADQSRTMDLQHQEIVSDGVNIHYEVCGSGDLTLLFVHGWCIDHSYWSYQSDGFCTNYRIVTLDLPGFGQSGKDRSTWTIEQYGRDINRVIDQLQLDNVVLVGHSMGGDIILEAALNNGKVIALVGVDNFKEVGMEFDQAILEEIEGFLEVLENNFGEVAQAYAKGSLFHPATDTMVIKRVVEDILSSDSAIAVASLKGLFEYTPMEADKLSKLEPRLYLINSNNTPTDTAALTATGVSFKVLEISGTGHYPMIEKPGEFNKLLREVLIDIERNQDGL